MQDISHIDPHVMTLPPLRLDKHFDLYYFKLNPHYIPIREQMLLNIDPALHNIQDFHPQEQLQSFIQRIEDSLPPNAHDVPINHIGHNG
jgi:hypothetical protein